MSYNDAQLHNEYHDHHGDHYRSVADATACGEYVPYGDTDPRWPAANSREDRSARSLATRLALCVGAGLAYTMALQIETDGPECLRAAWEHLDGSTREAVLTMLAPFVAAGSRVAPVLEAAGLLVRPCCELAQSCEASQSDCGPINCLRFVAEGVA